MTDIDQLKQEFHDFKEANELYHQERDAEFREVADMVREMHQVLTAAGLVGKFLQAIVAMIVAVGTAYLLIKQIFIHSN